MRAPAAARGGNGLHVAIVLAQPGRGGTEEQARLLAAGCVERGVRAEIFVLARPGQAADVDLGPAPVRHLDRARDRRSAAGLARATWRLRRHLRRGQFDVVHAVLARAHVLVPLVRPAGVRVVAWRRNLGDHLGGHRLRTTVERLAARRTDLIVANSAAVARYWEGTLRRPAGSVEVIPNALEPWRFTTVEPVGEFDRPLLVSVGGLRPVKGHRFLLEAAARLSATRPVRVAILGAGPLDRDLRDQARRLQVQLELPGHVDDPRPWLAAAAAYVHPSLSEGSSNAVLEAMAYGCPVVATSVGDAAEQLAGAGVVVPPGDADALATAIGGLLDDPPAAKELGEQARARAADQFSPDRMVEAHLAAYRRLAAAGRR